MDMFCLIQHYKPVQTVIVQTPKNVILILIKTQMFPKNHQICQFEFQEMQDIFKGSVVKMTGFICRFYSSLVSYTFYVTL